MALPGPLVPEVGELQAGLFSSFSPTMPENEHGIKIHFSSRINHLLIHSAGASPPTVPLSLQRC